MPEQRSLHRSTETGPSAGISVEHYASELYRFLAHRLRSRQEAEDLLQSVYVRFLQTPHTELIRQPRAYLYRIASNMISEFNLHRQREPVIYDSDIVSKSVEHVRPPDAISDVFGDQLALEEQLDRVINQLPATYRAVLLMRTIQGLSFEEIADKFGITEQSARKYLVRAIALCRKAKWE